jgi:hypothetical protein
MTPAENPVATERSLRFVRFAKNAIALPTPVDSPAAIVRPNAIPTLLACVHPSRARAAQGTMFARRGRGRRLQVDGGADTLRDGSWLPQEVADEVLLGETGTVHAKGLRQASDASNRTDPEGARRRAGGGDRSRAVERPGRAALGWLLGGLLPVLLFWWLRIPLLADPAVERGWNSDSAIFGLMAQRLRDDRPDHAFFFWGQTFLGPLTPVLAAGISYVRRFTALRAVRPEARRVQLQHFLGMLAWGAGPPAPLRSRPAALATMALLAIGPAYFPGANPQPETLLLCGGLLFWHGARLLRLERRVRARPSPRRSGPGAGFAWWMHPGAVFVDRAGPRPARAALELVLTRPADPRAIRSAPLCRRRRSGGRLPRAARDRRSRRAALLRPAHPRVPRRALWLHGRGVPRSGLATRTRRAPAHPRSRPRRGWHSRASGSAAALRTDPPRVLPGAPFRCRLRRGKRPFALVGKPLPADRGVLLVRGRSPARRCPRSRGGLSFPGSSLLPFTSGSSSTPAHVFAWALVVGAGLALFRRRARLPDLLLLGPGAGGGAAFAAGVVLLSFAFHLFRPRALTQIHYLVLAYPALLAVAADGWSRAFPRRSPSGLPIAALTAVGLIALHDGFDGARAALLAEPDPHALVRAIREEGYSVCYGDYWIAYRHQFLSRESVRFIPYHSRDRNPRESRVLAASPGRKCLVLPDGTFREFLPEDERNQGGPARRRASGK